MRAFEDAESTRLLAGTCCWLLLLQKVAIMYCVPAVQGFFRSIALSSQNSLQDTLRYASCYQTHCTAGLSALPRQNACKKEQIPEAYKIHIGGNQHASNQMYCEYNDRCILGEKVKC